jgi:SAM-dependent methyltransferase
MTSARVQGSLWGAAASDYAGLVEGFFRPAYTHVLDELGIGPGCHLLDVGCGPGLAAALAARRGAVVAGLDAAEPSIAIARERTPGGDFRVGDMETLPWSDATFDAVTSFNGFQFAGDIVRALEEAGRVTAPSGQVALLVWGRDEHCDTPRVMAAVRELLPPPPLNAQVSPPLSTPGRIEALLELAGLHPRAVGEVDAPFSFPDLTSAVRGLMSAGAAVAVVQRVGPEPVRQAVIEALSPFRMGDGKYLLQNRFRFVVASA